MPRFAWRYENNGRADVLYYAFMDDERFERAAPEVRAAGLVSATAAIQMRAGTVSSDAAQVPVTPFIS